MSTPIALTIKDAAAAVGVSADVIRAAIKRGDLIANYPTSRPVIRVAELDEWLKRRPTEPR